MKLFVLEAFQDFWRVLCARKVGRHTDDIFPVLNRPKEVFEPETTAREVLEQRVFVHPDLCFVDSLVHFFTFSAKDGRD